MRKGSSMFGLTDGHGPPLVEWCLRSLPSVTAPGWFPCYCGCGYVGVRWHCVPDAPEWVPWQLCVQARQLVASGAYRCRAGWLEGVSGGDGVG